MRIPIAAAGFCQDCQMFVDSLTVCECGSRALLQMATVMNRDPEPEYFPRLRAANEFIRMGVMSPNEARKHFQLEDKTVVIDNAKGEVVDPNDPRLEERN